MMKIKDEIAIIIAMIEGDNPAELAERLSVSCLAKIVVVDWVVVVGFSIVSS